MDGRRAFDDSDGFQTFHFRTVQGSHIGSKFCVSVVVTEHFHAVQIDRGMIDFETANGAVVEQCFISDTSDDTGGIV